MKEQIRNYMLEQGTDVCGFASIDRFTDAPQGFSPSDVWADCKSVISIGLALPKGLTYTDSDLIYGYFNNEAGKKIDSFAFWSAKQIEKEFAAIAMPIPCDGPYDYWQEATMTGKGILSMKHIAVACGLGTIGKNSLLLNPKYGNMLIVGAILTNLELSSDEYSRDICIPGCSKCVDSCPVQAIENGTVNQKACRTNTYGHNKRGFDTVECNKCRAVCPRRFGVGQ